MNWPEMSRQVSWIPRINFLYDAEIMISTPAQEFSLDVFCYMIPLLEALHKSHQTWQIHLW